MEYVLNRPKSRRQHRIVPSIRNSDCRPRANRWTAAIEAIPKRDEIALISMLDNSQQYNEFFEAWLPALSTAIVISITSFLSIAVCSCSLNSMYVHHLRMIRTCAMCESAKIFYMAKSNFNERPPNTWTHWFWLSTGWYVSTLHYYLYMVRSQYHYFTACVNK